MRRITAVVLLLFVASATAVAIFSFNRFHDSYDAMLRDWMQSEGDNPWDPKGFIQTLSKFDTGAYDILFFCDSVMFTETPENKKTISYFLEEKLNNRILTVAGPGYSPILFREYIKLINKSKTKPKSIIVAINPRSFSEDWLTKYRYSSLATFIAAFTHSPSVADYVAYNFFHKNTSLKNFFSERLYRDELDKDKSYFHLNNADRDGLLNKHTSRKTIDEQTTIHFINNYTTENTAKHPMFRYIKETLAVASESNVRTIVYITPVNMENMKEICEKKIVEIAQKNFDFIESTLKQTASYPINMTNHLHHTDFPDAIYANEHLNDSGRNHIADVLATAIRAQ
jgi:hypothetical protein